MIVGFEGLWTQGILVSNTILAPSAIWALLSSCSIQPFCHHVYVVKDSPCLERVKKGPGSVLDPWTDANERKKRDLLLVRQRFGTRISMEFECPAFRIWLDIVHRKRQSNRTVDWCQCDRLGNFYLRAA
jgi:hypothetical protein